MSTYAHPLNDTVCPVCSIEHPERPLYDDGRCPVNHLGGEACPVCEEPDCPNSGDIPTDDGQTDLVEMWLPAEPDADEAKTRSVSDELRSTSEFPPPGTFTEMWKRFDEGTL